MSKDFSIGDLVYFIVGAGPAMTVNEILFVQIHCSWFVGFNLHQQWFNKNILTKE